MTEFYYRYIDGRYAAPADEFGDSTGGSTAFVRLNKFVVTKHTPKGVWVKGWMFGCEVGQARFILSSARKKFACSTKELALESFLARKAAQRRIYAARVAHVDEVVSIAKQDAFSWQKIEEPV